MIDRGQSGPDRADRTKQSLVKWWHKKAKIRNRDSQVQGTFFITPRKTRPAKLKNSLLGRKESNHTNKMIDQTSIYELTRYVKEQFVSRK